MRILILTPENPAVRTGNEQSAHQWATLLRAAGHEVSVASKWAGEDHELLILLHADKSYETLTGIRKGTIDLPCILALTGTDLYPQLSEKGLESVAMADAIIVLQELAVTQLPEEHRNKVVTVFQSVAIEVPDISSKDSDYFDVCLIGHLREVKNPMLAPKAVREVAPDSRIRLTHAGGILESDFEDLVALETQENPRYRRVGELNESDTLELIASSRLLLLTSRSEGGARVIGEAVVAGTPVLSTHIDGVVGLLGEEYPGYFPVGDREALTGLLERCEREPDFYDSLVKAVQSRRELFMPSRELESLERVIHLALRHKCHG